MTTTSTESTTTTATEANASHAYETGRLTGHLQAEQDAPNFLLDWAAIERDAYAALRALSREIAAAFGDTHLADVAEEERAARRFVAGYRDAYVIYAEEEQRAIAGAVAAIKADDDTGRSGQE